MTTDNKPANNADFDPTRVQNVVTGASRTLDEIGVEILPVLTGGKTVHAKRIEGRFRKIKWWAASFWLLLFFGPYIRWDGHQAILWDIPNRQFHIFGLTILPQDIWMLAAILLFFAMLLAVSTAIAGRVWCGYFCFQTVWMDVFTLIEEKIQGSPNKRMALDQAPWTPHKMMVKGATELAFLAISFLTGFSFMAFFTDAFELWRDFFTGNAGWFFTTAILVMTVATYMFGTKMREQTCMWFCPYARIQGAMIDKQTVLPTYDRDRGEPRGRLKRLKPGEEAPKLGDCIDCNLCVAVCPTGVDIRNGQQLGCITCGLCIDACDSVMDKLGKPRGLIRYAALEEFEGKLLPPLFKRPRVIVYSSIMGLAAAGLLYGLLTMAPMKLNVLHERSPVYVMLSDGSIQNKFIVKVVNKTDKPMAVQLSVDGIEGMSVAGTDALLYVEPGNVGSTNILVKVPSERIENEKTPIVIYAQDKTRSELRESYQSMFIGPKR